MRIVQQGYRVQFEQEARAYQAVSRTTQQEYVRKVRTIAGAFQLFAREWWLLNPRRNRAVVRDRVAQGAAAAAAGPPRSRSSPPISSWRDAPFYGAVFALQTAFYAAAIAGHERRHAARRPIYISVPYAMCCMLWATVAAFHRFLTDRQQATWEQAPAFELPRPRRRPLTRAARAIRARERDR